MSKVDIIVPVYNAGKYLEPMIQSVLAQTYQDFTLILVSDGGADQDENICMAYAKRDSRIKFIRHEKNYGMSVSRDDGYLAGQAEWVSFLDADDILMPDFLERLIHMIRPDIDICGCRVKTVGDNDRYAEIIKSIDSGLENSIHIFDGKEIFHKIFTEENGEIGEEVTWAKIIRRSLMEKFISKLREKRNIMPRQYLDDYAFSVYLWYYCRQVAYTDSKLYLFRCWGESTSHKKKFDEHRRQFILGCTERINFLSTIKESKTLSRQTLNCFSTVEGIYYSMIYQCDNEELQKKSEKTVDNFVKENMKYLDIKSVQNAKKLFVYISARIFCINRRIWLCTLGHLIFGKK